MNLEVFSHQYQQIVDQGRRDILNVFTPEIKMIKPIGEYLDTNTPVSYLGGVYSETRDELVKRVEEDFAKRCGYITPTTKSSLSEAVRRCFTPLCFDVKTIGIRLEELLEIENVADIIANAVGSLEPIEKEIIHQLLRQKDDAAMPNVS